MKSKLLFIICACTIMVGCNEASKKRVMSQFQGIEQGVYDNDIHDMIYLDTQPERIVVTNSCVRSLIKLSSYVKSADYIRLSNDSEAMLGRINKIEMADSCVYLLDRYKTRSIKRFSTDGRFLNKIGRNGNGPGEYVEPTDFILTDDGVLVYDQFKAKINYYNPDGEFIRSKKVPFAFMKFHQKSPNEYLFYLSDADNYHLPSILDYSILETDSSFMIKKRGFFREKDLYTAYFLESNFHNNHNSIYYNSPHNDTIYAITPNSEIQPLFVIDFQKKRIPDEYLLKKNAKAFKKESDKDNYLFFSSEYFNLSPLLYFTYMKEHVVYRCFYSKERKELNCSMAIQNDLHPGLFFGDILYASDDCLVGYIFPHDLVVVRDKLDHNELVKHLGEESTKLIESLNIDDNPIIVKYQF